MLFQGGPIAIGPVALTVLALSNSAAAIPHPQPLAATAAVDSRASDWPISSLVTDPISVLSSGERIRQ